MNKRELMTNVNEILDKHLGNTIFTDPVLSITKSAKDNRILMELEFEQGSIVLEKELFKLKDVIARIEKFDLATKAVWLNEILNELGSDYGTLKYKAGYEQGKLEGEWVGQQLKDADKIRQELNKPMIPQFVADWIEYCKNTFLSLVRALMVYEVDFYNYANQEDHSKLINFLESGINQDLFARVWLDGFTVEKEKRYLVKIKGVICPYLNYDTVNNKWNYNQKLNGAVVRTHHTRKELEEAGFGWVFDCPGMEVEEVGK